MLSVKEIISHMQGFMSLLNGVQRKKSLLLDFMYERVTADPSHAQCKRPVEAVRLKQLVGDGKLTRKRGK
jgi:hypothetical protein